MAASGHSPDSGNLSEDSTDVTKSHRLRQFQSKPKRRHSIQVLSGFPFLTRQGSFGHGSVTPARDGAGTNTPDPTTHNKNRRQSISESLQFVTKSMSRYYICKYTFRYLGT